jgi:hypothetical protein
MRSHERVLTSGADLDAQPVTHIRRALFEGRRTNDDMIQRA